MKLNSYLQLLYVMDNSQGPGVNEGIADLLGLRWLLVGGDWQDILFSHGDRRTEIVERPSAYPRVRLVSQWETVPSAEGALQRLAEGAIGPDFALVEPRATRGGKLIGETIHPPIEDPVAAGIVRGVQFTLNSITVQVDAPGRNLLVIGDTWYPGWRAVIDGEEASIHRVNYMFRGVFIPRGRHEVRLTYFPSGFTAGCAGSFCALVLICFLLWRWKFSATPGVRPADIA